MMHATIITSVCKKVVDGFASVGQSITLDEVRTLSESDSRQDALHECTKHRIHLGTTAVVGTDDKYVEQQSLMSHVDTVACEVKKENYREWTDGIKNDGSELIAFVGAIDRLGRFSRDATDSLYTPNQIVRNPLTQLRDAMSDLIATFNSRTWNEHYDRQKDAMYCHTHGICVANTGQCIQCTPMSRGYTETNKSLLTRAKRLSILVRDFLPIDIQEVQFSEHHREEQLVTIAGCWAAARQWAFVALRLMKVLLGEEAGLDSSYLDGGFCTYELLLSSVQLCSMLCDIQLVLEDNKSSCQQWMHKKALSLASQWDSAVIAAAPLCGENRGVDGRSIALSWIGNTPTLYRTLMNTDFGVFGCGSSGSRAAMLDTRQSICKMLKHTVTWAAYSDNSIKQCIGTSSSTQVREQLEDADRVFEKIRERIVFWLKSEHGLIVGKKTVKRTMASWLSYERCMALDPTVTVGGGNASVSLRAGDFIRWDGGAIDLKRGNPKSVVRIRSSTDMCEWLSKTFCEYNELTQLGKWRVRSEVESVPVRTRHREFSVRGHYSCWGLLMPSGGPGQRCSKYTCDLPMIKTADELNLAAPVGTSDYSVSIEGWAADERSAVIKKNLHKSEIILVRVLRNRPQLPNSQMPQEQLQGWCIIG